MNARKCAFVPGGPTERQLPLERYLPIIPPGMTRRLLDGRVGKGGLILDPFGSSPQAILELAKAGYRIISACNNPIIAHMLRVLAGAYSTDHFKRVLASLAASRKGDERLEKHLEDLYSVRCPDCGTDGPARAFIWVKGASVPSTAILDCRNCKRHLEFNIGVEGQQKLGILPKGSMHRAMASERVASIQDPIRARVEQALESYLARPLYVIFTILNRLESLQLNVEDEALIHALLISVFDAGNTLWPHPTSNIRPKQLGQSGHVRENNLWMALNDAVMEWSDKEPSANIVQYPQPPPASGGITLYQGRYKELAQHMGTKVSLDGTLAILPRPNQAFWTLSAVWAGWLWGSAAVQPFRSALIRQRYDWQWYADALTSITSSLGSAGRKSLPVVGVLTEYEPAFLLSTLSSFNSGGLALTGYALDSEINIAQLFWDCQLKKTQPSGELRPAIRKALINQMTESNQPVEYTVLAAAVGVTLAEDNLFIIQTGEPSDRYSTVQNTLKAELLTAGDYIRYRGQRALETEIWWKNGLKIKQHSTADRIELAVIELLLKNNGISIQDIQFSLNDQFPGLLTPSLELIRTILDSYGEIINPDEGIWKLNSRENPLTRQADLAEIQEILKSTGTKFGYIVEGDTELYWKDDAGDLVYYFVPAVHTCISGLMINNSYPAEKCIIAIPASRTNLLLYKIEKNPLMYEAMAAGWRIVKFRHIRRISIDHQDEPEMWQMQLDMDPLEFKPVQMKMF